tara:strand:+ start:8084 stop:8389 length:306 start_codon:yes stop_codon:yes gene_type:complete
MQDLNETKRLGQPIYWYVVDIVWQTRRGKKVSIHRWKDMECVSRAKTLAHLNKDNKALQYLNDQTKLTAKKENFRVYRIKQQKIVGYSERHLERDYENEFT